MLIYVPLNHIDDNPFQRRAEYGDIEELASRIAAAREAYPETYGLMQVPRGRVVVVDTDTIVDAASVKMFAKENKLGRPAWNEDPKTFRIQLAFGHRRLRAFRYLHEMKAPGYEDGRFPVHIDPLTAGQMLNAVWAENYERKDISAVEQAELIKLKLEQLGPDATHAAIGNEWGLSRPVISNRLRLLELPEAVQAANRDGRLSERQALALTPIVRIGELTEGSKIEWGSKVGQQWGAPASPEKYIEHVLGNPDVATSDNVRDFTKRLTQHAGDELPGWLAKVTFEDKGIEQAQCKGCPFRINQSCLKPSCLKRKLKLWPDMALEAFSQETGIPISDRKEDVAPFGDNYKLRHRLRELYEAGETGGGMVCAWWVGSGGQVRPYGKDSGDYVHYIAGEKDGRCGIAIGYRGDLPESETAGQSGPRYSLPNLDAIAAWQTTGPKIVKQARQRLVDALSDAHCHAEG